VNFEPFEAYGKAHILQRLRSQ